MNHLKAAYLFLNLCLCLIIAKWSIQLSSDHYYKIDLPKRSLKKIQKQRSPASSSPSFKFFHVESFRGHLVYEVYPQFFEFKENEHGPFYNEDLLPHKGENLNEFQKRQIVEFIEQEDWESLLQLVQTGPHQLLKITLAPKLDPYYAPENYHEETFQLFRLGKRKPKNEEEIIKRASRIPNSREFQQFLWGEISIYHKGDSPLILFKKVIRLPADFICPRQAIRTETLQNITPYYKKSDDFPFKTVTIDYLYSPQFQSIRLRPGHVSSRYTQYNGEYKINGKYKILNTNRNISFSARLDSIYYHIGTTNERGIHHEVSMVRINGHDEHRSATIMQELAVELDKSEFAIRNFLKQDGELLFSRMNLPMF